MDFFQPQESLAPLQWVIRAIIAYGFLILAAKFMGQRSISQLRLLDFVIALILGNILAHPLSDEGLGMEGSLITTGVLTLLYVSSSMLSLKYEPLRRFLEVEPIIIIKDGQILYQGLKKARISLDALLSELRKKGIADIQEVAIALWEPSGILSVFAASQYQPLTPKDLGLPTKPFALPIIACKEGQVHHQALKAINKDEKWLQEQVSMLSLENILLASIGADYQLHVILKDDEGKE